MVLISSSIVRRLADVVEAVAENALVAEEAATAGQPNVDAAADLAEAAVTEVGETVVARAEAVTGADRPMVAVMEAAEVAGTATAVGADMAAVLAEAAVTGAAAKATAEAAGDISFIHLHVNAVHCPTLSIISNICPIEMQ